MASGVSDVGSGFVVELTQSRNVNAAEALAIFHTQLREYRRRLTQAPRYRAVRFLIWVLIGAILALLYARPNMRLISDVPPLVVIGALALLFFAGLHLWRRSYFKNCGELYRDGYRANRQFRIERNALIVTDSSGMVQSIPWSAINNVVTQKDMLAIYFSSVSSVCLLKAAYENQDVEGFCTELQRRWEQGRGVARHGPAE